MRAREFVNIPSKTQFQNEMEMDEGVFDTIKAGAKSAYNKVKSFFNPNKEEPTQQEPQTQQPVFQPTPKSLTPSKYDIDEPARTGPGLYFKGSKCTKDCSGHTKGYNDNQSQTGLVNCDQEWGGAHPSLFKGCNIANGEKARAGRIAQLTRTTTFEDIEHDDQAFQEKKKQFLEMFEKFLPIAMRELDLKKLPKMVFEKNIEDSSQPTFGQYVNNEKTLYVALSNRHPVDILRTIAHELVHYWQDIHDMLDHDSGKTGSPEENQAHEKAGIIMRNFNKANPQYMSSKPIFEGTIHSQYNHVDVVKKYKPTKTLPRNDSAVENSEKKMAKLAQEAEQTKAENRKLKRKKQELENYLTKLSRPE